jgi:tetratricopeptide (TPR) repeat protein
MENSFEKNLSKYINQLEKNACFFIERGFYREAIELYFLLSEGDDSFDAGGNAFKIGICYEKIGDIKSAVFWYFKATSEAPFMIEYKEAHDRLLPIP